MTNYSPEDVTKVMQDRNLTRKSAIQFLRRQRSTNSNLLLTATPDSNAHKATEELETLPPVETFTVTAAEVGKLEEVIAAPATLDVGDQVETAPGVVQEVAAAGTSSTRRARNTGFDAAKAVELYKAGVKVVDIAVQLGYERGQGQNRTRTALKAAGVLVEKETVAPAAPVE